MMRTRDILQREIETMREIILPEAKPALEWVRGRVLQKLSPKRKHALAQMQFASALQAWAGANACGTVGTEWEFRVQPPGRERRPLVPDVAYISFERLPFEDGPATDIPNVAPDVVVEVLSPGDLVGDVEEKVRTYLASGTLEIFLVDTETQTVTIRDYGPTQTFTRDDVVRHRDLPGFAMDAAILFDPIKPRR